MWANAQCDGRPVEYRRRPLLNAAVWLMPTTRVPCAVMLPIQQNARLRHKVNFVPGVIPLWGKSLQKCIYTVAAQEMAKHRAKFGWPPVSDVVAVTKPRHETS